MMKFMVAYMVVWIAELILLAACMWFIHQHWDVALGVIHQVSDALK